jgi:hypothetical protein
MLTAEEGSLVPSASPVQSMCSAPPLLRRHAAEDRKLFGTRLLVRQHGRNVALSQYRGKPVNCHVPERHALSTS